MDEQRLIKALGAIRDLAVRLLSHKMPTEVSTGLRHINKMARHGYADPEPDDEIVYDEPHETSDGLTYRIFVWRENGKFLGRLYHPPCHGFFNVGVPLDSQEAAIKTAMNSVDPNHKAACKK
jgi:hypothetical protein